RAVLSLCDAPNGKGGTWNEAGVILFSPSHNTPIYRVAAAGGKPVQVTELDAGRKDNSHRFPQFLPDGDHFIYLARVSTQGRSDDHEVRLASLAGGEERLLLKSRSGAIFASDHLLFMREGMLMAQRFDTDSLHVVGDAFPVADGVQFLPGASRGVFAASVEGTLVYQRAGRQSQTDMVWVDRAGEQLGTLGEPGNYEEIVLSPDGRRVVMGIADLELGTADLWIHEVVEGSRTRFTFNPADDANPVWSPDSTRIVFRSMRKGVYDLFVKSVAGQDPEQPLLSGGTDKTPTAWSPDGRFVLYTEEGDIWALPMDGSEEDRRPFPVLKGAEYDFEGTFSPDGRWLLYTALDASGPEVYATRFPEPGRKWQISRGGGVGPVWGQDGKEILWVAVPAPRVVGARVVVSDGGLRVGQQQDLMKLPRGVQDGTGTPDFQRFLLLQQQVGDAPAPLVLVQNWSAGLGD
ncbi:MAG: TolB family protein, partial [Acidobacteriota bacterium]